mgnify:CR=1 FL=1|jgi:hypothetical protein
MCVAVGNAQLHAADCGADICWVQPAPALVTLMLFLLDSLPYTVVRAAELFALAKKVEDVPVGSERHEWSMVSGKLAA